MELKRVLSKTLRELRTEYGYTLKGLAEKLDLPYQTYQSYELGKSLPPLDRLVALAEIYDVSMDYLVGRKEF